MATTFAIRRMFTVSNYSKHQGFIGQEAPSQTFKRGNLISNDANGLLAATPAGAGALVANVIANRDGQNLATPTSQVPYVQTVRDTVIEITAGGAAASTSNMKRGGKFGYAIDGTTGIGYLDLTNTTNQVFQLEKTGPVTGAVGDTNVRVYVKLLTAAEN
jgi:hypothetical protein